MVRRDRTVATPCRGASSRLGMGRDASRSPLTLGSFSRTHERKHRWRCLRACSFLAACRGSHPCVSFSGRLCRDAVYSPMVWPLVETRRYSWNRGLHVRCFSLCNDVLPRRAGLRVDRAMKTPAHPASNKQLHLLDPVYIAGFQVIRTTAMAGVIVATRPHNSHCSDFDR